MIRLAAISLHSLFTRLTQRAIIKARGFSSGFYNQIVTGLDVSCVRPIKLRTRV